MISNGYLASPEIQISTENHEIVPEKPSEWTNGYRIKKLSFSNVEECTLLINNETEVKIPSGRGFEMGYDDPVITSFIIKESGIQFNFVAAF